MTNGGFFETRKTKPIGLIAIIAVHAVLLTAIALNPTRIGPHVNFIPQLIDIHDDPTPPPTKLPPPKPEQRKAQAEPTTIDPVVETRQPTGPVITLPPVQIPEQWGSTVTTEPVFVAARMDPNALGRFQPGYPSSMVRAGIEGIATVRILIGSDGRVKTVEPVTATDPSFFEATKTQALRYWRFQPATRDGIAVESWRTMTVKFKLES